MRQQIVLEPADLATLTKGKRTLTIRVGDIAVDLIGGADPGSNNNGIESRQQPCPYCAMKVVLLGNHIRNNHPGKGLVATGGHKCRFCPKRFPTLTSIRRHEIAAHLDTYKKAMTAKAAK